MHQATRSVTIWRLVCFFNTPPTWNVVQRLFNTGWGQADSKHKPKFKYAAGTKIHRPSRHSSKNMVPQAPGNKLEPAEVGETLAGRPPDAKGMSVIQVTELSVTLMLKWSHDVRDYALVFARLNGQLERSDPFNRSVISNPRTYIIKTQPYTSNCSPDKQTLNSFYLQDEGGRGSTTFIEAIL